MTNCALGYLVNVTLSGVYIITTHHECTVALAISITKVYRLYFYYL